MSKKLNLQLAKARIKARAERKERERLLREWRRQVARDEAQMAFWQRRIMLDSTS